MSEYKQLIYTAAEIDERLGRVDKFSNPNLLINPFFQINQRGFTSSSSAGYTVDGWRLMSAGHMVEVMPDKSLKVTASSSAVLGYALAQLVENYSNYEGKTVTISAIITENTTTKGIRLRWNDSAGSEVIYGTGLYHGTITIPSGLSYLNFGIQFEDRNADNGNYFIIKGMKVELGEISTLANDVPPKISTDLAECQRYALKIASSLTFRCSRYSVNTMTFVIPVPVTMRINPSIASGGFAVLSIGGGSDYSGFTFEVFSENTCIRVVASKTDHGLTDGALRLTSDVVLSAEL